MNPLDSTLEESFHLTEWKLCEVTCLRLTKCLSNFKFVFTREF